MPSRRSNTHPSPAANSGPEALVLRSKLVPHSNSYVQRYYFALCFLMTLAVNPPPHHNFANPVVRASLSSLAFERQSETQLHCFQSRAHSFVKTPGLGGCLARATQRLHRLTPTESALTQTRGATPLESTLVQNRGSGFDVANRKCRCGLRFTKVCGCDVYSWLPEIQGAVVSLN